MPASFTDNSPFIYLIEEYGLFFPYSDKDLDVFRIGSYTINERRKRIKRYIDKKRKRTYTKRVNYDCRKRVAEQRVRIKGRFVTKE
ncbi:MAG: hypothetical protein COA94_08915 [Rickettsiales bacterium]|nr:MAG: hypothetical protein COA94_08915 [Rickettsiales bacterium]